MSHRFARDTTVVATRGGGTAIVKKGEVWSSHAPIVIDNPELFSAEPTVVHGEAHDAADAGVEDATAKPGVKRAVAKRAPKGV